MRMLPKSVHELKNLVLAVGISIRNRRLGMFSLSRDWFVC